MRSRTNEANKLKRYGAPTTPYFHEELILAETPEQKLYCAIVARGFMDYWRYWKLAQRRPLTHIERMWYVGAHDWLFIDDPEYLTLYVLSEYISDFPEVFLEKSRHLARENTEALRLAAKIHMII